jgi:hypothetical protein
LPAAVAAGCFLAAGLLVCGSARAQVLAPPAANGDVERPQIEEPAAKTMSPGALVERAASQMSQHLSVVAKVRQRGNLYGRELIGSGDYAQGPNRSRLLRYEIRMKVGAQIVHSLQVCDDRYLWISRQLEDEPIIQRVEVDRILAAYERQAAAQPAPGDVGRMQQALAVGGLGHLLASLRKDFQFHGVAASKLGDLPVQVVTGAWKGEALSGFAASAPKKKDAGRTVGGLVLRPHVPDQVVLFLGADDLFPYRIEFRRLPEGAEHGVAAAVAGAAPPVNADPNTLLLALELYEVQINVPLEERLFQFAPGSRPYTDVTELYLQQMTALP